MKNAEYQKLKRVKQKVEREWLNIPGVVAVGIGKTGTGKPGLIVSVTELSMEIQTMIPTEIEGVPVELKESGPFQAL